MILSGSSVGGNVFFIIGYIIFLGLVVFGVVFLIKYLSKNSNPAQYPAPNNKYDLLRSRVFSLADKFGVDTVLEWINELEKKNIK